MQFPSGAPAMGLAALTGTLRQSATKEPLTRGQLRNPRSEVALGGGEFRAVESAIHLLYISTIQDKGRKSRVKIQCEYASPAGLSQKRNEIRCFRQLEILVAEPMAQCLSRYLPAIDTPQRATEPGLECCALKGLHSLLVSVGVR